MKKWFSTNHKNIGILYFIFDMWVGMISSSLSIIIYMKLSNPLFIYNDHMYNSIITMHAFIIN